MPVLDIGARIGGHVGSGPPSTPQKKKKYKDMNVFKQKSESMLAKLNHTNFTCT